MHSPSRPPAARHPEDGHAPSAGGVVRSGVRSGLRLVAALVLLAGSGSLLAALDASRAAALPGFLDGPVVGARDTVETDTEEELDPDDIQRIFGAPEPAADTTRGAELQADTTVANDTAVPRDTTVALDTTAVTGVAMVADTSRVGRLLPPFRRDQHLARVAPRRQPLTPPLGRFWTATVELDTTETRYTLREHVGGDDVRIPTTIGLDAYREARRQLALDQNFRELERQRRQRQQQRRGVGIGFEIPGGAGRGLQTIFGSDQVDLRVNGQTNVNVGFSYRKNEQQQAATGQGGRVDPDFGQELGLSIVGTIGDKLEVNVNYDTQNDFDFQNQVRLTYTGYEDDIIQRIEAGNVFLPVESELIRGGQRLFGLKTDLQIGGLAITAVASQQDAESDELVIEGGSQSTPFQVIPSNYENNAHFYLGYYFYNRWDVAHSSPPNPVFGDVRSFENIEVYKFDVSLTSPDVSDDVVAAVALLDLGEPVGVLEGGRAYLASAGETPLAPAPAADRYNDQALGNLRQGGFTSNGAARARLEEGGVSADALRESDLVVSRFKRLRPNQDYTVDETFGTISLNQPLNESDVLAVAYTYRRADGTLVRVGDVGQGSGSGNVDEGPRIVLKLLRPSNLQPRDAAWDLTMRNIYRVGGRGLDPDGFDLQIYFAGSGQTPQRTLPGVEVGARQTLLQTLGLDRVTQDGQPGSDDLFDFLPNYTIRPGTGRVIFPYREPFGERLRRVIAGEAGVDVRLDGFDSPQEAIDRYVFEALYTEKPETAARQTDRNVFRLSGSSRGTAQENYDLGFAIVEGSVEVRSGGSRLTPGTDYTVDYTTGSVTIVNPAFLTAGRDIRISYERQQFLAIQKKTLLGVRARYDFTDRLAIGATWMRLTERPLIDKYRIGEEPISNSIWGLDARYEAEPQWITRLVDAIPLVQTRAPSRFEFRGEFAQLNPGHPETIAFDRSRDQIRNLSSPNARDFKEDELRGISYVDDFEGTENTFSLMQPAAWRLASGPTGDPSRGISGAGPDSVRTYLADIGGGSDITRPGLRSNWRGLFGWYAVVPAAYESDAFRGLPRTSASREIRTREVFPERQVDRNQPHVVTTFDLYFDPHRRGPYNFNADLAASFTQNPQKVWGGMMQRLPDGYRDFEARNNIEFVEFIFSPFAGRMADQSIDPDARLVIDLGRVSEDVLPDGELNTEDGLLVPGALGPWGRRGSGPTDGIINVNQATRRTEDLGLNGLASGDLCRAAAENGTPYEVCEEEHYASFLAHLRATLPANDPRLAQAEINPSADEYRSFQDHQYFQNQAIWPGGPVLQEHFSQFHAGLQGNSLEAQTQLGGRGTPGNSRVPDTEDLYLDGSLNTLESFFRYEIPLHPDQLRNSPFFVEEIYNPGAVNPERGDEPITWYVIRIPVRTDEKEAVGGIDGFREVSAMRMWTQGHSQAATLRFAKLELVGSQWLKSADLTGAVAPDDDTTAAAAVIDPNVFIATVNTEENPSRYRVPNGAVRSFTRDPTSGSLIQNREQSLVLLLENLSPGAQAALFKPYTRSLDLTKYENLRMFVHGSGFEREDSLQVFVRLGANESGDYYEIEQPLYAWQPPNGMTVLEYERFLGGDGGITNAIAGAVADSLWQMNVPIADPQGGMRYVDRNSINVAFAALNMLKVERDLASDPKNADAPWPLDRVYRKPVSDFAGSDVGDFAPPGAVLRIRGTPSIQNISTIVIGVRRAADSSPIPTNAEVWFNELRVAGYEEQRGWSAFARANLRLADLADVNVRYARQTDNFGSLTSGLGDRTFQNEESFQVASNIYLNKLIPERFGWQIPVNLTLQNRLTTPRFSPRRGDITVEQEIEQIRNSDLPDEEKRRQIDDVRASAESSVISRTLRVPISKRGSNSDWLRYTLDGLSFTYTGTQEDRRSPQRAFDNVNRWNSALTYRLAVPRPKTVRPLWFLEEVPVLGLLGDLKLNVLPQSVRLTADANRDVTENQERARRGLSQDPVRRALDLAAVDDVGLRRFLQSTSRRHTFGHNRNIDVQYSPFGFLTTGFSSRVRQSLDAAGADRSAELLVQRLDAPGSYHTFTNASFDELFRIESEGGQITALGDGFAHFGIDVNNIGDIDGFDGIRASSILRDYAIEDMTVRPFHTVFGDVLTGERPIRTDNYQQTFNFTLQSPFDKVKALNWMRLSPISYTSTFGWGHVPLTQFGLEEEDVVANLSTTATIRGGLNLRMRELMSKIGPWKDLDTAQREAEQEDRRARQQREAQLTEYRRRQDQVREAERALRAAEAEAAESGEDVPDELRAALDRAIAADTLARPAAPSLIPDPLNMARRTLLAVTGARDIAITYDRTARGQIGNVQNAGFSLLSSIAGSGPPIGFRIGAARRYPADDGSRFFGDQEQAFSFSDQFADEHRFGARTSLEFSPALRMDLSWDTNFSERETEAYSRNFDLDQIVSNFSQHGSGRSSVWALGGSYDRLFDLQLDRLYRAGLGLDSTNLKTDALSSNAVAADFRRAFTSNLGTFGSGGFFALPLPNWNVTYSGLTNWPIIRTLARSATLRHGYSSTYEVGYRSFSSEIETRHLQAGPQSYTLTNSDLPNLRSDEPRVNQRFQPLVGLDMNLRAGIQANVNYNMSSTRALSTTNARLTDSSTDELSVRLSFSQTGFRLPIPFMDRRLSNQVRFSLVLSKADNLQRAYTLRDDLQSYIAHRHYGVDLPETFRSPLPEATTRLTIEPQVSYTVSNAVTAAFFVRYERFEAENSRIPTTSNVNGGFNFRVSFSN